MVSYILAPDKRHAISNHHVGSSIAMCHMSHISWNKNHITVIKQIMLERGRENGSPLVSVTSGFVVAFPLHERAMYFLYRRLMWCDQLCFPWSQPGALLQCAIHKPYLGRLMGENDPLFSPWKCSGFAMTPLQVRNDPKFDATGSQWLFEASVATLLGVFH